MTFVAARCTRCGAAADATSFAPCPACGGGLELAPVAERPMHRDDAFGIWRQLGNLGLPGLTPVSLGEGATPLVPLDAAELAARSLLKLESCNPTGSWKDRLQAVNVSVARWLGFRGLSLVSTGNSALAAAAYGNRAGLAVHAYVWRDAPATILAALEALGAATEIIDRPPDLGAKVVEDDLFPATMSLPSANANPFGLEGYRTIAYEIAAELGRMPDWVSVPVGCGDGLFGIAKGFDDLRRWGLTPDVPRLLAVQAEASAPLVTALNTGREMVERTVPRPSRAVSIADPVAGDHALAAVRRSSGAGVAVTEAQIAAAERLLLRQGIVAEPASAAAVAGVLLAREQELIDARQTVVTIISSSGLRWLR